MKNKEDKEIRRASNVLSAFHVVFLIIAIAAVTKIVITQYFWEPDPEYLHYFQPRKKKMDIDPDRGAIIDHNGNLLAMSTPMYNIYIWTAMCRRRLTTPTRRTEPRTRKNG